MAASANLACHNVSAAYRRVTRWQTRHIAFDAKRRWRDVASAERGANVGTAYCFSDSTSAETRVYADRRDSADPRVRGSTRIGGSAGTRVDADCGGFRRVRGYAGFGGFRRVRGYAGFGRYAGIPSHSGGYAGTRRRRIRGYAGSRRRGVYAGFGRFTYWPSALNPARNITIWTNFHACPYTHDRIQYMTEHHSHYGTTHVYLLYRRN